MIIGSEIAENKALIMSQGRKIIHEQFEGKSALPASPIIFSSRYSFSLRFLTKSAGLVFVVFITCLARTDKQEDLIMIENAHMRYTVSSSGKNLEFVDLTTRINYLNRNKPSYCAQVIRNGKTYTPTNVS